MSAGGVAGGWPTDGKPRVDLMSPADFLTPSAAVSYNAVKLVSSGPPFLATTKITMTITAAITRYSMIACPLDTLRLSINASRSGTA